MVEISRKGLFEVYKILPGNRELPRVFSLPLHLPACTDLLDPGVSLSWQEELANFCIAGVILWMLNMDNERRLMMKGHMYYSMCCF